MNILVSKPLDFCKWKSYSSEIQNDAFILREYLKG